MDKIESAEQYQSAVRKAKASGWGLSNCFFLPDAIRQKSAEGTLFFSPIENGLLLLDDRGGFFRCYYFLSGDAHYSELSLPKDAVIEFPFNNTLNEKQRLQEKKIRELGFTLGRESGMMYAAPEDIKLSPENDGSAACTPAGQEDAPAVLRLLYGSFDPLYAFLPDEAELRTAIGEGCVLVRKERNALTGALLCELTKDVASIHQIAVDPAFRGKGIGKALLGAYHAKLINDATSFQHWVDLHNAPAVKMYGSVGYRFNLRKANEYIKLIRRNKNA